MWTRRKLKERAKEALQRNYWKLVLVSALLMLLGCEAGGYNFSTKVWKNSDDGMAESVADEVVVVDGEPGLPEADVVASIIIGRDEIELGKTGLKVGADEIVAGVVVACVILIAVIVLLAVVVAADIFLINPFDVGGKRFMRKSIEDAAQVKEVAYAYDHSYKNVVKVMFCRDLYTVLWTLLFIIPGIVKMYQYLMVPYILSETPDMDCREALDKSRDMMDGNKWKAFVLGLSFILWDLLGALTLGIVEVFYVNPYRNLTFAALYDELKITHVTDALPQTVTE
ncbi:MAG: DUF975 family protein [Bacteroidales bacterium]|nr:DUF975 family protein [Bacteroidales bacterium]MCM1415258.1 DUF975 family protein [bacterium]MCM1423282.1 DUF975 family protein [bacterium]